MSRLNSFFMKMRIWGRVTFEDKKEFKNKWVFGFDI